MKNRYLKFIFILIFLFFSINILSFDTLLSKTNDLIQLNTNRLYNFDDYSFTFADIDITLQLIIQDKNFDFDKIKYDFRSLLLKYSDLFNIQFSSLRNFITNFLNKYNFIYSYNSSNFNQFYFIKLVSQILLYDEKFIDFKRFLFFENKLKLFGYKFDDSLENYLYFISSMFQVNKDIKEFYDKYKDALNKKVDELELNYLLFFFLNSLNIKDKDYKILIDIIPTIYKYKNRSNNKNGNSENLYRHIENFEKGLIHYKGGNGYIAVSYSLLKDRFNLVRLFFKSLFYQELNKKNISGYEFDENNFSQIDFDLFDFNKFNDPSILNMFITSLRKPNKEDLKDFYSELASYYLIKKLENEDKDFFDKIDNSLQENYLEKNKYEFYLFLTYLYLFYCDKMKISFSSIFEDSKVDKLDFFSKFLDEILYKNKEKIIKRLIDTNKILELTCFEIIKEEN